MKLNKIISAVAAFAMMASVASAAVEFEYSDGYYIDNVNDVLLRTPSVTTDVHQMTSDEVVALGNNNTTSISNKKLKNAETGYANTSLYTVYRVTNTVNGIGDLAIGYDRDDNEAYIKLMRITTSVNLSGVTYEAVGVAGVTDTTTGVAWSGGGISDNVMLSTLGLGTDNAYPKSGDTAEGALINQSWSSVQYYVLPAGHAAVTIPYDTASAGVNYLVKNGKEGYNSDLKECLFASTSFTLEEASTTTDAEVTAAATEFGTDENADGFYNAGVLFTFEVGANNNPVNAISFKANNGTITTAEPYVLTLPTTIEAGTAKVAMNILDVPTTVTSITLTDVTAE